MNTEHFSMWLGHGNKQKPLEYCEVNVFPHLPEIIQSLLQIHGILHLC